MAKEVTMKIGIDSYCYHRYFGEICDFQQDPGKRITFDQFLQRSSELGVDVVSLETCFFPKNEEDFLKRIKDLLDKNGLEPVVAWGHPDGFEGGKKPEAAEDLKKHLKTCQELNAQIMRIVVSSLSFRHEPHGPQIERVSKILKDVMPMVEDYGVKLAIENHFDFTSDELSEIIERVDSPFLGVNFDSGNALRIGEDPVEAARKLINKIFTTHIKDVAPLYGGNPADWYFFASVPAGKGIIDLPALVQVFKDNNYQGSLTLEIDYLDPKYGDEDQAVAESISYLRKIIE